MSDIYEESVSEPEEVRMARLHSLLTKTKSPLLPKQKHIPRRPLILSPVRKSSNPRQPSHLVPESDDTAAEPRDTSPANTPSRPLRTIKPPPHLPPFQWRASALLTHHLTFPRPSPPPPRPKQPTPFPFFSLPPELRTHIYTHLLTTPTRLLPTWRGPAHATRHHAKLYTAILRTCSAAYTEGTAVLYGSNVFDFGEICNRPDNFSAAFVARIGARNAGLIRVVLAEWAAAGEELGLLARAEHAAGREDVKPRVLLTVAYLRAFLGRCGIALGRLRVLGVRIVPYGVDTATEELLRREEGALRNSARGRERWLEGRNEAGRMEGLVEGICVREKGFRRAEYWVDVHGWIGGRFAPSCVGREWVVYQGVRGREEGLVEGVEEEVQESAREVSEESVEDMVKDVTDGIVTAVVGERADEPAGDITQSIVHTTNDTSSLDTAS